MKNKIDWELIKKEYQNKNLSKTKLAEKFGITLSALRYHAKKNDWDCNENSKSEVSSQKTRKKTYLSSIFSC